MATKTFTVEAHCDDTEYMYGPTHLKVEIGPKYAAHIIAMVAFATEGKKQFKELSWIEFVDYSPDWVDEEGELAKAFDDEEMRFDAGRILVEPDGDFHYDAYEKNTSTRFYSDTINVRELEELVAPTATKEVSHGK